MRTWLELEERFRRLNESLSFLRLDYQWGSAGEYWRLAGMQRTLEVREFVTLCEIAGRALVRSIAEDAALYETLMTERTFAEKWYRALKELSGEFRTHIIGDQKNEKGQSLGHIYSGTLDHPVKSSVNLCLYLEANYPIPDPRSFWERVYDDYGKEIVIGTIVGIH